MKNMKRFAALMMLLCALMICTIPAFAAGESDAAKNATEAVADESGENDVTSAKAMGSGLMIGIACLGGALAMGIAVARSSEAIARQPEAKGQIRTSMMMGLVFIETVIIYALIVAILIIFVLGGRKRPRRRGFCMPLNINLQQILLHALNFVILFGALYFLLYKPVRDFMDSRKAHYEKMDADAKAALAQAEKTKEDFAAQLKGADEEIARRQREANDALQHAVDERRAQAEQQAEEIIKKAHDAAASEHERVMGQARGEIAELMSAAAEKLVLSSTSDAYDKFLDTAEERKNNG